MIQIQYVFYFLEQEYKYSESHIFHHVFILFLQCQKKVLENNEGGDGMLLNYETKLKSMEKMFEELKVNV